MLTQRMSFKFDNDNLYILQSTKVIVFIATAIWFLTFAQLGYHEEFYIFQSLVKDGINAF